VQSQVSWAEEAGEVGSIPRPMTPSSVITCAHQQQKSAVVHSGGTADDADQLSSTKDIHSNVGRARLGGGIKEAGVEASSRDPRHDVFVDRGHRHYPLWPGRGRVQDNEAVAIAAQLLSLSDNSSTTAILKRIGAGTKQMCLRD